eukprot:6213582-Pleurochrysis_carterae.AAC.6
MPITCEQHARADSDSVSATCSTETHLASETMMTAGPTATPPGRRHCRSNMVHTSFLGILSGFPQVGTD